MTQIGQNMLLTSAFWGESASFKLIPAALESPYIECIYDSEHHTLVVIAKDKKSIFHMMAKLNENGDPEFPKVPRKNGKHKEERKTIETCQEHYLMNKEEITAFIELFAVNAKTFDYKQYFRKDENPSGILLQEKPEVKIHLLTDKDQDLIQPT